LGERKREKKSGLFLALRDEGKKKSAKRKLMNPKQTDSQIKTTPGSRRKEPGERQSREEPEAGKQGRN